MPTTRRSVRSNPLQADTGSKTSSPSSKAASSSTVAQLAARRIKKHRKVRTGCETCKGRKVKCDEARPICGNCSYHDHSCVYHQKQSPYPIFADTKNGQQQHTDDERDVLRFSSRDMGLLHHWTIHTASTIGATPELRALMRDQIPCMAIEKKQPYLLHAALAVTALHHAFLNHSQRDIYAPLARHHYAIALPLFRENLPFINPENCHALYSCSQIIVKYLFAAETNPARFFFPPSPPPTHNDSNDPDPDPDPMAEIITLIKGAYLIRDSYHPWLNRGPLAAVTTNLMTPSDPTPAPTTPYTTELTRLDSLLARLAGHDGPVSTRLSTVRLALHTLQRLLALNTTSPPDDDEDLVHTKGLCTAWLAEVPKEFFVAVRERKPEALVVLGHFCVVLEEVNCDEVWYMRGWGRGLWRECVEGLRGEGGWAEFVTWPATVFGALERGKWGLDMGMG